MKNINNVPVMLNNIALIFAIILFSYVSGCDLAKPQGRLKNNQTTTEENNVQPANENEEVVQKEEEVVREVAVPKEAADTSIKLDQTFEDKEYGFRFNYPGSLFLEKGEGIMGAGKLTLWFSKQTNDPEKMILLTVTWMIDRQLSSTTKAQITQDIRKEGGSLKLFEKIKLDNQDCIHFKVAFGGMFDPRGYRVSEQYLLVLKQRHSDLIINFSAPSKEFETYRPQFQAILNSFKIDNSVSE
ncbi:MAG: hypothetical protein LBU34_12930 [Planctomycetaceae bacterium]|jgi:hypothetical protein|nr:hypothetical protein [Planctomycetaceae bacterium]